MEENAINKTLQECIIRAMDVEGMDTKIIKYLPYILQDHWELGTPADKIISAIKKHKRDHANLDVLELGSGKGAASVKISSELKCRCFGIDAIEDFVEYANNKAKEYSVSDICTFEKNDVRTRIKTVGRYDVIVLGGIGPVFGNYYSTLSELKLHLNDNGVILIDDAYTEDDSPTNNPGIVKKGELLEQIKNAGMTLAEEMLENNISGINEEYDSMFENIKKRCMELAEKRLDDKALFFEFIEKQKNEFDIMKTEIIPAMLIIKMYQPAAFS